MRQLAERFEFAGVRVLVLQQPGSVAPFERWMLEVRPDIHVRILTGAGTRRPDDSIAPGVPREVLADYVSDPATARILEVCRQWRPDVLFSNAEDDVLRCAEARSLFGIPGMTADVAVAFRDKVLMKQLFEGVAVAGSPDLLGELHRSRLILEPYVTGRTFHVEGSSQEEIVHRMAQLQ
jgi:hypothetical protein